MPREFIAAMLIACAVAYGWWANAKPKTKPLNAGAEDSDQLPPKGAKHWVERILTAAKKAPATVQVKYLRQELTFAQVLAKEVERLENPAEATVDPLKADDLEALEELTRPEKRA